MSIGLYISYHNPSKEDRLVPIASDHVFENHWKPLCQALRLRWVSRFQKGWTLSVNDIAPILQDLATIRHHIVDIEPEAEMAHHLLARIGILMRELNEVGKGADLQAFIGGSLTFQRRPSTYLPMERRLATRLSMFRTTVGRPYLSL